MGPMTRVGVALGILGLCLLSFIGLLIYCLITEPIATLAASGVIIGFFILLWAAAVVGEEL